MNLVNSQFDIILVVFVEVRRVMPVLLLVRFTQILKYQIKFLEFTQFKQYLWYLLLLEMFSRLFNFVLFSAETLVVLLVLRARFNS